MKRNVFYRLRHVSLKLLLKCCTKLIHVLSESSNGILHVESHAQGRHLLVGLFLKI